jgi:hypothetical protein
MDSWWNFFYLCGSAAATLTGLMFIAVPLGCALIRRDNLAEVNVFLSPLCFHFLHVFFLCCMTAVPRANPWLTGIAAFVSASLRLTTVPKNYSLLGRLARKEHSDIDRSEWMLLVVLPTVIYVSFIPAGIGFLSGKPWAVPVLAGSCLVLLMVSARGAWDTLVAIAVMMPSAQNGAGHEDKAKKVERA